MTGWRLGCMVSPPALRLEPIPTVTGGDPRLQTGHGPGMFRRSKRSETSAEPPFLVEASRRLREHYAGPGAKK